MAKQKAGRAKKKGEPAKTKAGPAKQARKRAKVAVPLKGKGRAKPTATPTATGAAKPVAHRTGRSSGPPPMFQRVAFTMFSVENPDRARSFYEDLLGLTRGMSSADGTWTEYDLPGGGCLALFRHPDPSHARPAGGAAIALEVADLDALNQRLQAASVVYQGGLIRGPRCRMSNIVDSEGNSIILHQLDRKP